MSSLLERLRAAWNRVFFWQQAKAETRETKPDAHDDHALVLSIKEPKKVPHWKQLRFLNRVLSSNERRIFWGAFGVFLLALGAGGFVIVRTSVTDLPAAGGSYTEAVSGSPKRINPLFAPLNDVDRDLAALVFSGLFRVGPELEAIPDLAARYTWLDGGKTLEVAIRDDARFHDGEPVTSDDVQFTIMAAKNPAWRSPLASLFRDVTVVRVDERTIQFQLPEADPTFLLDLTVGILPAHVWEDVAPETAQLSDANLRPIGSGPYRVHSFTRDGAGLVIHYDLRRFTGYYGIPPFVEEWRLRFFPDQTQAVNALRNGQVDGVAFLPWTEAEKIRNESIKTYSLELPITTVAFFNTKDALLKDLRVRQALALAVDPDELSALVGEQKAKKANGPYPFLEYATGTKPDLEAARKLLDAIGWKLADGSNVRSMKPAGSATSTSSTVLQIRIDVPNQPDLLRVADLLKRRWSLLGAQVDVRSEPGETLFREALALRNSQVIVSDMLLLPDLDLTQFFGSAFSAGTGRNFSNLADRDTDAALEAVRAATNTEMLISARKKVSDLLSERLPALFLLRPTYAYAVSSRVNGIEDLRLLTPSDRFSTESGWFVRTRWGWKD